MQRLSEPLCTLPPRDSSILLIRRPGVVLTALVVIVTGAAYDIVSRRHLQEISRKNVEHCMARVEAEAASVEAKHQFVTCIRRGDGDHPGSCCCLLRRSSCIHLDPSRSSDHFGDTADAHEQCSL